MILWRLLPWRPRSRPPEPGGALWFPRPFQGTGRHDNPQLYGCMYASESPISPIAESLAPFRGAGPLSDAMLTRAGLPLALAQMSLDDGARLTDLDDPATLAHVGARPSAVATRRRAITQRQAAELFAADAAIAGIRWWSTLESTMINLTIFDRSASQLSLEDVSRISACDAAVQEAAELLGLRM